MNLITMNTKKSNEINHKIKALLITFLCAFFLTACGKTMDIKLATEVKMFASQEVKVPVLITEQDEEYVMLNNWLAEHQSGWFTASGRFQGGIYFKSGEQGIQVTKTKVIIYSTKGSKPQALYAQEIKKGDLNKLLALVQ